MDVASLIVKVTTTGVQTTQQQLDKLANTASATQKVAGGLNLGMLGLSATLGLITKEAIKMGDEWTNINSKLNLVTKTTQDFNKAQTELFNISQNTRTSLSASVELYRKLAVSTESLNISQNRLLKVTETINKAGMVGGGSKESINAALIQLGQGLASGTLRGEELNSVLEQTPRLAKLIADGMGVQVGALKSLAEAGKITSETIIKAAEDGAKGIAKEFDVIQVTFSSSLDVAEGSVTKLVGTLDEATGATRTLSQTIIEMSKYLNENNTDIVATGQFIYATISRTIDVFNVLYETVENTAQIVVGHINLLVYGSLEGILTLLTKATEGLNSLGIASDKGLKEAYADLAYVQGLVANANNLIADSYNDLNKAVVKLSPTIEDRIKQYNAENKAISDKLALQKKELETTTGKSKKEVEAELKAEKEKEEARKKAQKDAIKLAEEWQKRKIEIATNISIAEQDKLAEPFIKLEAKYKQDLEHFKGNKEAQIMLTNEYNAEVSRLQEDLTKKFNEEEKKKAKKSAEWQVKLLEANEKYNDEIIKMQDEMYGTDSSVEQWYNNQLEYLGKLSQEAGATSEELQTLLDKIETIKAMKLEKQTISFKVEQSFYQSFENNLADSIEGAFNGDLNFKKFFRNIGNDLLKTVSSSFAGIGTSMLRGNYSAGLSALGMGASLVGSSISASDIGSIMNSGGTFDSNSNTVTTSGGTKVKLDEAGSGTVASTGSDIMSLVSTLSTLKTAYTVATAGLSASIQSGFVGLGGLTGIGAIGEFGAGFANPFAYAGMQGLPSAMTYGSMASAGLMGGAVGYGTGWLGDKLLGANSYASIGGLAGGALGGIGASLGMFGGPVGIIAGSLIGSALGGIFGKKKTTDTGIQFFDNTSASDTLSNETVRAYQDWEKKGWFSKSSGTELSDLSSSQMKQIEAVFDTYDYLLTQLGDTDKIILGAGKYSGESFADELTKKFIEAFNDINQSTDATIYNAWKDYAESVNKTTLEAITESINTFITTTRAFDVWALNRSGKGIEALAKQAQWAQDDFENLSNMLGVTGVTVENYTQMYREAVKNSLTPETITQWESLGTALMTATDASDTYLNTLKAQNEAIRQSTLSILEQQLTDWISALGSIQNAMDNLNPTFMTFAELAKQTISLDNYSTLLSQLESSRQNEIEKLTQSANERIKQLEDEKTLFLTISEFVDELTQKIIGYSVTTSSYFFSELANAKSLISSGGTPDISSLKSSASSYLDKALGESTSKIEYLREVAKVREGIGGLGSLATGGSLEGIENAINQEEETLASKLDEINKTALAILAGYKGTATSNISSITAQIETAKTDPTKALIDNIYTQYLGVSADAGDYKIWADRLAEGTATLSNLTNDVLTTVSNLKPEEYSPVRTALEISGAVDKAKTYINGSHATGLDYVPFDGYVAELHKGERVQTASEVKNDSMITDLTNSIKDLKDMFIKNIAETSRMSRVITRLDDNDALLVRVVV